jgi:addiction module HigA family antidote
MEMQLMSRSSTTTKRDSSAAKESIGELHNPHPGEILKLEFLNEIGLSQNHLAQAIGVPGNRVHAIVNGMRDISADTDLRLCRFFGLTEGYFLRLQNAYDTLQAKRHIGDQLSAIKPYKPQQAA